MSKQTAIVVREGETGGGAVIRVILVPNAIATGKLQQEVASLAAYGNQCVDFIGPDQCRTFKSVKAIFDGMNPPDVGGSEES